MTSFPQSGSVGVRWGGGEPCGCAQVNPAADPPLGAISALYDELGRAVAVGELANRLGVPDGAALVESVAAFVSASDTVLRSVASTPETGSLASSVGARLTGQAAKAWGVVETSAAKSWRALSGAPTRLLVVGAGVLLASQYLSAQEAAELEDISLRTAVLQDVVMSLPVDQRAAALASAGLSTRAGVSVWGWVGLGLVAVAGVWAWRKVGK